MGGFCCVKVAISSIIKRDIENYTQYSKTKETEVKDIAGSNIAAPA